ncbi:phosphofurin acidic cluster sorting protein 2 [Hyalella azteca]|uniref:Phosphofurin acidic cluster sorting protein 2 n=1 Tax=Hyalella azteca TaxID=294128 RepID=A0A979FR42_HYAAZ|nr:phosphofurin acidic cluster sorting protein 2 [Hyalella azteca]
MAERQNILSNFGLKPVPMSMKLFATGDMDKTPANCIPRLCNVTITHLVLLSPTVSSDLSSVLLAVKMHSSKRTLRSNEMPLSPTGALDTDLQLCYSLQVLQRPQDQELDLYAQGKDKGQPVARVTLEALSSQPVECDDSADARIMKNFLADNPGDYPTARQRNLKQRFVALLKKIKVPEALQAYETDPDLDPRADVPVDPDDIEYLMNELEDLSDSGNEVDTLSISSTPKPSLRPYFSSTRSLLLQDPAIERPILEHGSDSDHPDTYTDAEQSDPQAGGDVLLHEATCCSSEGGASSPPTAHKLSSPDNTGNSNGSGAKNNVSDKSVADKPADKTFNKSSHKSSKSVGGAAGTVFASVVSSAGVGKSDKRSAAAASSASAVTTSSHRQDAGLGQEPLVGKCSPSTVGPGGQTARKGLQELLATLLPPDDCKLPPALILIDASPEGSESSNSGHQSLAAVIRLCYNVRSESSNSGHQSLAAALSGAGLSVVTTTSAADVRATVQHIINKLQKFCNSNAKAPGPMKVVMVGSDPYINSVLRPYVTDFSLRPPDFLNHIRFLIVPLGGVSSLAKYLGSVDSRYGASFVSECWREARDRWEPQDVTEAVNRINRYLTHALSTLHLPIAEAMLTYKDKGNDNESSQTFIPFLTDVRLGSGDVTSTSIDLDDVPVMPSSTVSSTATSSQPSSSTNLVNLASTPPSLTAGFGGSGNPAGFNSASAAATSANSSGGGSALVGSTGSSPGMGSVLSSSQGIPIHGADKTSRENTVTPPSSPNINTFHLPSTRTMSESEMCIRDSSRDAPVSGLTFSYATKENKKRIMRLGKKKERERESESRRDVVDGVTRVLASTKSTPVTVTIDSVEWPNVKFFQLSSQWQTQVKTFPVCLFNLQSSNFGGDKI